MPYNSTRRGSKAKIECTRWLRSCEYCPACSPHLLRLTYIGVSQRIDQPEKREAIKNRLAGLMTDDKKGRIIVRTRAQDASNTELKHDMFYLRITWDNIHAAMKRNPAPTLLYQDLSLAERVLHDVAGEDTTRIRIDSAENFEKIKAFTNAYMPNLLGKLTLHRGERALFDLRVDLKSGGYLMIDQTESMATIDVNTSSYVGAHNRYG